MLRLPVGQVTVLLGSALARRQVMELLDDTSARCAGGDAGVGVLRLRACADDSVAVRLKALAEARHADASVVLIDRFTDGLEAKDRREVLSGVRDAAASGCAVLVDDIDPVAALAVAANALRIQRTGQLVLEPVA